MIRKIKTPAQLIDLVYYINEGVYIPVAISYKAIRYSIFLGHPTVDIEIVIRDTTWHRFKIYRVYEKVYASHGDSIRYVESKIAKTYQEIKCSELL